MNLRTSREPRGVLSDIVRLREDEPILSEEDWL